MTLKINSFDENDFVTPPTEEFLSKFKESLFHGFFYAKIPSTCEKLLPLVRTFAKNIPGKKESYEKITFDKRLGFSQIPGTQTYALIVRSNQWDLVYGDNEQTLARNMQDIGIKIFKCMLKHIFQIPEDKWEQLTGKALTNDGGPVLSVLSYVPDLESQKGYFNHQDIGWMTVLSSDKEGLYALVNKNWYQVPPKENHFVVMFGGSMEQLINDQEKLNAPYHYVEKLNEPRTTLALYINSANDQLTYQIQKDGTIKATGQTFKNHVKEGFKKCRDPKKVHPLV